MDAIVGFPIHRGVLAFGDGAAAARGRRSPRRARRPAIVVVLFGVSNHDNIGGIFRNAAAFGASAVLLDAPAAIRSTARRSASRSAPRSTLPFARLGAGRGLRWSSWRATASRRWRSARRATTPLHDLAAAGAGGGASRRRGPRLAGAILARAETIRIPMDGGLNSLNLATTSGIVLHHLASAHQGRAGLRSGSRAGRHRRALHRRHRPGHHLLALHHLRRGRRHRRHRPEGAPADLSHGPAGSSTTPRRSGPTSRR